MAKKTATGFDGLAAFSTDVEAAIAAADRISAGPRRNPPPASATAAAPKPVHRDGGAIAGGVKKAGGWILGIGLVIAVKACIFSGVHAVSDGGSSSSYSSAAPSAQSTDTVTDMNDNGATSDSVTAADASGDGTSLNNSTSSRDQAAADAASSMPLQDDGALSKPAPGFATLNIAELRYCLAEDIRVSAQRTEMDGIQYSDVERFNRNVDGFNETVNDYNSRCSNRSIVSAERPVATSQVEQQRSQLAAEGRERVQ